MKEQKKEVRIVDFDFGKKKCFWKNHAGEHVEKIFACYVELNIDHTDYHRQNITAARGSPSMFISECFLSAMWSHCSLWGLGMEANLIRR